jgi:hypothetical protein
MISPDLQLAAIRAHCEREGYEIVEEIADIDESGRRWGGRQIERAVTMLEVDAADVLVVSRWSRIARNRVDWTLAVERIDRAGKRVESATEPVDATTSAGRFTRNIFAEQAAFESDRQADYARAKHARRLREGLPVDAMERFGYRKVGREYIPDPVTGKLLASMYRRYGAGRSFRAMTIWLLKLDAKTPGGLPNMLHTPASIRNALDHGFGAGLIWAYGRFHPGKHQAVISEAVWRRYEAARDLRRQNARSTLPPHVFEFNGLIFCAVCGGPMIGGKRVERGRVNPVYVCRTQSGPKMYQVLCPTQVRSYLVDFAVLAWLREFVDDSGRSRQAQAFMRSRCQASHTQARALELAISERGEEPQPDDLARLADLTRSAGYEDPVEHAEALIDDWLRLSPLRRRARLQQLIEKVLIQPRGHGGPGGKYPPGTGRTGTVSVQPLWAETTQDGDQVPHHYQTYVLI